MESARWDCSEPWAWGAIGPLGTGCTSFVAPWCVRGEIAWRRGRWAEAYATVTTEMWATPIDVPGIGLTDRLPGHDIVGFVV